MQLDRFPPQPRSPFIHTNIDDDAEKERKRKKKKKRRICCCVCLLILLLLGLLVFFLFPRIPTMKETKSVAEEFTLNGLITKVDTSFKIHVWYDVKNPNYVKFGIDSFDLEIYHIPDSLGGVPFRVGTVKAPSKTFDARKTSEYQFDAVFGDDNNQLLGMILLFCECSPTGNAKLQFTGKATAKYLGFSKDIDVDFTDRFACSTSGSLPGLC